jgi:ribosome modulation factor
MEVIFIMELIMLTKTNKEGIQAYINGQSVNDNPYYLMGGNESHYNQWQDGFLDAEAIVNNEFDQDEEVKEYMEQLKN